MKHLDGKRRLTLYLIESDIKDEIVEPVELDSDGNQDPSVEDPPELDEW
jgi:hypothetical protein